MGLSALKAQRFHYNLIPFRHCQLCPAAKEDPIHFFLHCPILQKQRDVLLKQTSLILAPGSSPYLLPQLDEEYFTRILLQGSDDYSEDMNNELFSAVQAYIKTSNRFNMIQV